MKFSKRLQKFQQGGPMPEESAAAAAPMSPEEAPAGAESAATGEDQMAAQLQQVAGELLNMLMQQIRDPQAVAMILQMALEMLQSGREEQLPPEEEQPVYQRQGGRLKRIR